MRPPSRKSGHDDVSLEREGPRDDPLEEARQNDNDIQLQCAQMKRDLDALREEVQSLRSDLTGRAKTRHDPKINWPDQELEQGSEVYTSSFAATAWSNHRGEGARLYINQNYTMTELKFDGLPNKDTRYQWDRGFVFPTAQLPGSAMATANSYLSKDLIPDPDDRGGSMRRVFYFDMEGTLCEWSYKSGGVWRRSNLQIKGAETYNIAATCCAQDGFAAWSLFYVAKGGTGDVGNNGRRLMEIRSIGAEGKWSKPYEVGWPYREIQRGVDTQVDKQESLDNNCRWTFSAATRFDGTNRCIFILQPFVTRSEYPFHVLRWCGASQNKWNLVKEFKSDKRPRISAYDVPPSHASIIRSWGMHIFFQDGSGVSEWLGSGQQEEWSRCLTKPNVSSQGAPVASMGQVKGDKVRNYFFSTSEGRVIQTTWISESKVWVAKPITIRRL